MVVREVSGHGATGFGKTHAARSFVSGHGFSRADKASKLSPGALAPEGRFRE
jgi:hypothetical protein